MNRGSGSGSAIYNIAGHVRVQVRRQSARTGPEPNPGNFIYIISAVWTPTVPLSYKTPPGIACNHTCRTSFLADLLSQISTRVFYNKDGD